MSTDRDVMITRIVNAFFGDERHRKICGDAIRKALREIPGRSDHGYILHPEHMDYGDLRKPGKVLIHAAGHQVQVEVANFEFNDSGSCRQQVTKAMCWARDVLNAAIENDRIVPGGRIVSIEASEPGDD